MICELIFTSAPQGLRPGTFGYCTVARSSAMSDRLAKELEKISAYDFQGGAGPAPVVYSFRRLKVADQEFAVLSCIRACDQPDYSGRTNYIAHHLAFDNETVDALLASQPLTPAEILLHYPWRTEWDEPPRELVELIEIQSLGSEGDFHCASHWATFRQHPEDATLLLAPGYEARPSYLTSCPDRGETPQRQLLHLFHESLLTLCPWRGQYIDEGIFENGFPQHPAIWWNIGFTTCRQQNDKISDFSWIGLFSTESGGRVQSRQIIDFGKLGTWEASAENGLSAQAARDADGLLRSSIDARDAKNAKGDLDRRVTEFQSGFEQARKLAERACQKFEEDAKAIKNHELAMADAEKVLMDVLSDSLQLGTALHAVASNFTATAEFNTAIKTQEREKPHDNWNWIRGLLAKAKNRSNTCSETYQFLQRCGPNGPEKEEIRRLKVKWEELVALRDEARQFADRWAAMDDVESHFRSLVVDLEKWIAKANDVLTSAAEWQKYLEDEKERLQKIWNAVDTVGGLSTQDIEVLLQKLRSIAPAVTRHTPGLPVVRHGEVVGNSRPPQAKRPKWQDKRILVLALIVVLTVLAVGFIFEKTKSSGEDTVATTTSSVRTAIVQSNEDRPPIPKADNPLSKGAPGPAKMEPIVAKPPPEVAPKINPKPLPPPENPPSEVNKTPPNKSEEAQGWMYIILDGSTLPKKILDTLKVATLRVSALPRKLQGEQPNSSSKGLKYSAADEGSFKLNKDGTSSEAMFDINKGELSMSNPNGTESLRDYCDANANTPGYEIIVTGLNGSGSLIVLRPPKAKKDAPSLFSVPEQNPFRVVIDDGVPSVLLKEDIAKALPLLRCLDKDRPPHDRPLQYSISFIDGSKSKAAKAQPSAPVDDPGKARLTFSHSAVPTAKGIEAEHVGLKDAIDALARKERNLTDQIETASAEVNRNPKFSLLQQKNIQAANYRDALKPGLDKLGIGHPNFGEFSRVFYNADEAQIKGTKDGLLNELNKNFPVNSDHNDANDMREFLKYLQQDRSGLLALDKCRSLSAQRKSANEDKKKKLEFWNLLNGSLWPGRYQLVTQLSDNPKDTVVLIEYTVTLIDSNEK